MAKLVFFGTEEFSLTSLQALIDNKYEISLVLTKPDTKKGRHGAPTPPAVKILAEKHGLTVSQPTNSDELFEAIKQHQTDWGVVVSYGKILSKEVLGLFSGGLINVHASLLPKYRGASPIEQAILNGDEETGITIMLLNEGMDSGPVYTKVAQQLDGTEKQGYLYDKLAQLGSTTLTAVLPDILSGSLTPTLQNEKMATYANLISKADGKTDWSKTATELERQVRAYQNWPTTYFEYNELRIILTDVAATERNGNPGLLEIVDDSLFVYCAEGALKINKLKVSGRNEMSALEFISGYAQFI